MTESFGYELMIEIRDFLISSGITRIYH